MNQVEFFSQMELSTPGLPVLIDIGQSILAVEYFLLILIAIYTLSVVIRNGRLQHYWQWMFYIFLLLGCIGRLGLFVILPLLQNGVFTMDNKVQLFLLTLPSLFFLTCYFIILIRLAEMYHSNRNRNPFHQPTCSPVILRLFGWLINLLIYLSMFILFLIDVIYEPKDPLETSPEDTNGIEVTISVYSSALYTLMSIVFFVYGILLFRLFRETTSVGENRKAISRRLLFVFIVIPICFLLRVPFIIISIKVSYYLDWIYYTFLEVLPLLLMLRVLHMGDSKTISISRLNITSTQSYNPPPITPNL